MLLPEPLTRNWALLRRVTKCLNPCGRTRHPELSRMEIMVLKRSKSMRFLSCSFPPFQEWFAESKEKWQTGLTQCAEEKLGF